VYPAEVVDWDMNITLIDDLLLCNLKMLELLKKEFALGDNVVLHPDAKVIRSVIGHNVVIEYPITIQDTVIFPDTRLPINTDLRHALLANDHIFAVEHMP
jgi:NDP-sugar pyrophosphorylase family protein